MFILLIPLINQLNLYLKMYDVFNTIGAPRRKVSEPSKEDKFIKKTWRLCMLMASITAVNVVLTLLEQISNIL